MKKTAIVMSLLFLLVSCSSSKKATEKADVKEATATTEAQKSPSAEPAKKGEAKSNKMVCQNKKDVREISLSQTANGSCEVKYKKSGEEKTVAKAQKDPSYCIEIYERIPSKLQKSGFTCKE